MHEISAYDYLMANLHLSMEGTDDDHIYAQPELFSNLSPEDHGALCQVLINSAKQSTLHGQLTKLNSIGLCPNISLAMRYPETLFMQFSR